MSEPRLLPIFAETLSTDDLNRIKEAKAALDVEFLVKPVRALVGSPGRILAIGSKPDFIAFDGYAFIPDTTSKGLGMALAWVLGDADDPRAITAEKMMKEIFGEETREIDEHDKRGPNPLDDDERPYRSRISDNDPRPGSTIARRRGL
jgi:hypothetical protein